MFYSTITPNIFFDLLAAAGYALAGLLLVAAVFGAIVAVILKMGLLALAKSDYPVADTLSIEDLERMFDANEPTAEERARAYHPAGRNLTSVN